MKDINKPLFKAIISLVLTLLFVGGTFYLFTDKSFLEVTNHDDMQELVRQTKIQLTFMLIIVSGVLLAVINLKFK